MAYNKELANSIVSRLNDKERRKAVLEYDKHFDTVLTINLSCYGTVEDFKEAVKANKEIDFYPDKNAIY